MKLVRVAAAAIVNGENQVLIAKRPDHAHQGGLWEFPGGKIEAGESIHHALSRELREEIGIIPTAETPLIKITHHYPDKSVHLDVRKVTGFSGQPKGMEGQPIQWANIDELDAAVFPAANGPIIDALQLPNAYMITGQWGTVDDFSDRLERALQAGVALVQLRIKGQGAESERVEVIETAIKLCRQYEARLLLNTASIEYRQDVDGLHLTSAQLQTLNAEDLSLWQGKLIGASCHSSEEVEQALALGARYISISPVAATTTHPGQRALGWQRFADLASLSPVPVYALGGMAQADIAEAIDHGGQGIAAISEFWQ